MLIAYWSSASGNTHRFVERLGHPAERIPDHGDTLRLEEPFVLVCPTYAAHDGRGAVPKPVVRFLNREANRSRMLGVIGGGNRNFGETFALAARVISAKCEKPVLHRFELAGTEGDVALVRKGLDELCQRVAA